MEENQPKTGKFSLNYGLILGGLSVVFGIMLFTQELHTSQSPALMIIGIVMAAVVTFIGISNFRKANKGFLTLSEALKIGAGIALISAIIAIVYNLVLTNVIDPDTPSKIMDARLGPALESGEITQEQFDLQKEQSIKFWWMGYPFILIINVIIGLVLGLITGLILKKAKPAY
ncbi:DUF4199 domain-containing protein [Flagellimonas aquimarina]|jgi:preprotein translocase subunit YajC|uniref:DUF4199 domain-containing protein n=1 Tax=Flagellimonas aquimarina TaxID=2201895 RepID=A0A316KWA9_9FLAO|nr:DUF4199 domain-containing protein [Allomuricauda koreensis]PWL38517.1 DUF4199 domain-containing protein [Allomuricauda koreensis]